MRTPDAGAATRPFTRLIRSVVCTALLMPSRATTAQLPEQQTPIIGGAGGTVFVKGCGRGHVLTGLRGREGLQVDAVGILCAPVLKNGALGATSVVGDLIGGTGGTFKEFKCPTGTVVSAFSINYGMVLNQVYVQCRHWNSVARKLVGGSTPAGELGNAKLRDRLVTLGCDADTQPASGIRGRSATVIIDAMGLVCDEP
jgi:hypothetical protein